MVNLTIFISFIKMCVYIFSNFKRRAYYISFLNQRRSYIFKQHNIRKHMSGIKKYTDNGKFNKMYVLNNFKQRAYYNIVF